MMCTAFTPLFAASSAEEIFAAFRPRWCVGEQVIDLAGRQTCQQATILVEHAGRVGQQNQLLGLQDLGDLAATTSALML